MENFSTQKQSRHRKLYQPELVKLGEYGFEVNERLLNKSSIKGNTLTTEQLQEQLGVSHDVLRACRIGTVLPLNAYLIWHQGRNNWKVYEEKLTV